jgi:leucyl aminopeptidase (aminopeptidase T)
MTADLAKAVQTVIRRSLGVQPGEQAVIVGDSTTVEIVAALRDEAQRAGADATLLIATPREIDGAEPSPAVAAALARADAFILATGWSLSHTQARSRVTATGARGGSMPHVTADMLARLMAVDFDALGRRSHAVAALLSDADRAHVSCPLGTDLELDLSGRHGIADDGDLTAPGAFGNLPCGEGFIAPVGGEGTLLATSLAAIGIADPPARLVVRGGEIVEADGPAGGLLLERLTGAGSGGTNLAELGVGTNEHAGLTGNVLEDEKILGTVHVAFGASAAFGGTVAVPVHLDVVVTDATLTIGDTTVIDAGTFVL